MDLMIPFNAVNGDRVYDAEDVAAMLGSVVSDGVHPSPGSSLMLKAEGGWAISVQPGRCAIRGHIGVNDEPTMLTVDPPNGTLPRIDAVLIRCDFDARIIEERVVKGTPASQPETPGLQRDEHAWELMLARVNVQATAEGITQLDIADTRWNGAVCGVMHSLIEVGAEGLFAQFEEAWAVWFEQIQQESEGWQDAAMDQFQEWLDSVQDLLDENAAISLASAVTILQNDVEELAEAQSGTVFEKARETGSIYPSDWTMNEMLGLWQARVYHSSVTYTDTDAVILIHPDSLNEPVLGSGSTGLGFVTVYASRRPGGAVNYTLVVTGKRE
ncbi:hypothetical protein AGMMS49992_08300 [Clostridia bacterium]|nr:hypothetical protein AGMMS49992_08300 [Clostridia bacterium]